MNKVLCIGEALIDMICIDKGMPLNNGNNFLKKAGGAPTNVAAAIAALGGNVDIAAKVGNDPFGQHLIETMQAFNVDTKYMWKDENHFTTLAFVSLLENGERDFVFSRGADGQLSVENINQLNLREYSIVHFGSATAFLPGPLQAAYLHLLNQCLQQNKIISFDPNYRHLLFAGQTQSFIAQSWHYLKQCHFFKLSDEEALLLTKKATLADAITKLKTETKAVFAITIGAEGTILYANDNERTIPSISVTVEDTTGAGDAFVGAVLFQLSHCDLTIFNNLNNEQWNNIIANGNKAGARTCSYIGAMEAFKHLNKSIFN